MKQIKLTKGMSSIVDNNDYDHLSKYKWYARKAGKKFYAARSVYVDGKTKVVFMHREILNTPKEFSSDHINHDTLDNRKYNLRSCTSAENNKNKTSSGKSKYLGVSLNVGMRKGHEYSYIVAYIRIDGKNKFLGNFKTEEEAARAYDEAAKKYHGEFANLNFKKR